MDSKRTKYAASCQLYKSLWSFLLIVLVFQTAATIFSLLYPLSSPQLQQTAVYLHKMSDKKNPFVLAG